VVALGGPNARGIVYLRPAPCVPDFNMSGGLEVQDIFDYLNAWFAGDPRADFNGGGLAVQDIFDFLNAWFAGC
jgi:glycosylphosphatidylinositol phospholipase D